MIWNSDSDLMMVIPLTQNVLQLSYNDSHQSAFAVIYKNYLSFMNFYFDDDGDDDEEYKKIVGRKSKHRREGNH